MLHILLASLGIFAAPSPQANIPIMYEDSMICSAVLIDPTHVLTAAHCMQQDSMNVMCGSVMTPGVAIREDDALDLAELELVEPCGQPVSKVADSNPARGDTAWTLGCPAGICGRISKGVIVGYGLAGPRQVVITDAKAWFGNSGGGLFNDEGEVVGICSSAERHARPQGDYEVLYTSYIPASVIHKFLDSKPK